MDLAALLAHFRVDGDGADEGADGVRSALCTLDMGFFVGKSILKEHADAKKARSWYASAASAAYAVTSVFTSPPTALSAHPWLAGQIHYTEDDLIALDEAAFLDSFRLTSLSLMTRAVLYKEYMRKRVSNDATTGAASNAWRRVHTRGHTFYPFPNIYFAESLSG